MKIQGLLLALVVCLWVDSVQGQNAVDNIVSALQPPPAPLAPPPIQPPPGPPAPGMPSPGPCPYAPDITAADCPNQSCYAGPPNGCGSRSLLIIREDIVPDKWPAGVNFNEACNAHDTCYFTPGSQKDVCDNAFHEALLQECRRALACANLPVVGQKCFGNPSDNPLFEPCQGLADLYFSAVQRVGQDPFNRDQQEATQYADQCRQAAARRAG